MCVMCGIGAPHAPLAFLLPTSKLREKKVKFSKGPNKNFLFFPLGIFRTALMACMPLWKHSTHRAYALHLVRYAYS